VQQGRRKLVEQMRIVDADHRMTLGDNAFAGRRQEGHRIP
jgi:hypothetical protein